MSLNSVHSNLTFQIGPLMPSRLIVAGIDKDYLKIYRINYSLAYIEFISSVKAVSSEEYYLNNFSQPGSIVYAVFVLTVSVIGIFGT